MAASNDACCKSTNNEAIPTTDHYTPEIKEVNKCRKKGWKTKRPHLNRPTRKQLAIFHLPNSKSQPPKSEDPDQ